MKVKVSPDRLASLFDLHHLRLYRLARRISGDPVVVGTSRLYGGQEALVVLLTAEE